jgi:MFS family permease
MTEATRLPRALRPFATVQYRLLVAALAASLLSAGAWLVAAVWQVVELGGSPVDLSYVAVGASLGLVVAVLFGGVAADRIPQRRILIVVEIVRGATFATAAVLAASGSIEVWHLAVLSFVLGLADGFFYPAYSAWLPALLPAELLLAANGVEGVLRPAVMQAAGPALASALIAIEGPWLAFAVVAVLQAAAVAVLAVMRTTPVRRDLDEVVMHPVRQSFIDLRDGFRYLLRTRWLFVAMVVVALLLVVPIAMARPAALVALLAAVPAVRPIRLVRSGAAGRELIAVLGATGQVQLAFGVLLAVGLAVSA